MSVILIVICIAELFFKWSLYIVSLFIVAVVKFWLFFIFMMRASLIYRRICIWRYMLLARILCNGVGPFSHCKSKLSLEIIEAMVGKHRGSIPISQLQAILFGIVILLDCPLPKFKDHNELCDINGINFYVEVNAFDWAKNWTRLDDFILTKTIINLFLVF